MNVTLLTAAILALVMIRVRSYDTSIPLYNRSSLSLTNSALQVANLDSHQRTVLKKKCYLNNVWTDCPTYSADVTSTNSMASIDGGFHSAQDQYEIIPKAAIEGASQDNSVTDLPSFRRMIDNDKNFNFLSLPLHGMLDGYLPQNIEHPFISTPSHKLNMKLNNFLTKPNKFVVTSESLNVVFSTKTVSNDNIRDMEVSTTLTHFGSPTIENLKPTYEVPVSEKFSRSLDNFERKFYATTFNKLTAISPAARRENGMSYVQSGLFLQLALMALSAEVGLETRREIDDCLEMHVTDQERVELIDATVSSLPPSSDNLKFRWSSRLVLNRQAVSEQFRAYSASVLRLQIDKFNGTETPKEMADTLNYLVEIDSGGAIHNTFEEDELTPDVRAVLINTLYLRARWRSSPTLLNGTRPFRDSEGAPRRSSRMIRVNDVMQYADLTHWDAEALEIPYSTPGLSLLILVPRGSSLRRLVGEVVNASLSDITALMRPLRVAATLPLYTLRMTLLLPNKLQAMNISRLVEAEGAPESEIRLSLAVQRIMFWAEAGRNAFKDDGLEWDEAPQKEIIVDRPYIFYVRWKNKTLMNGNFVL